MGLYTSEGEIATLAVTDETGTSLQGLQDAATIKGMKSIGVKNVDINQLQTYNILVLNIDDTDHFVVYLNKNSTTVTIFDPNLGLISMNMTQFQTFYNAGGETVFILNTTTIPLDATQLSSTEMGEIKALSHWGYAWHIRIRGWTQWDPYTITIPMIKFYLQQVWIPTYTIGWSWLQWTVQRHWQLELRWYTYLWSYTSYKPIYHHPNHTTI